MYHQKVVGKKTWNLIFVGDLKIIEENSRFQSRPRVRTKMSRIRNTGCKLFSFQHSCAKKEIAEEDNKRKRRH
jgi:hypothetical protein